MGRVDGKVILDLFYSQYLSATGLSKSVFIYELARHCRDRRSVKEFFDGFLEQVLAPKL